MTVKSVNRTQRRKVPSHVFSIALACGSVLAAVALAQSFPERPNIAPGGTNWEPADPSVIESNGGLTTADLNSGLSPTDVVNALLGTGVTISNVTFSGANHAAGTFAGGTGIIGFGSGVVLSSGNIATVVGPNRYDDATTDNSLPGDADLDGLIPGYTTDPGNIRAIARFVGSLPGDVRLELINFNPLAEGKYLSLDREYPLASRRSPLSDEEMAALSEAAAEEGVTIG